jgi:plastocyanin domain-containing protein
MTSVIGWENKYFLSKSPKKMKREMTQKVDGSVVTINVQFTEQVIYLRNFKIHAGKT